MAVLTKRRRKRSAQALATSSVEARLVPGTWNEKDYTVEVVWSTGARYRRYNSRGKAFDEELSMEPDAVDLSKLKKRAHVLDNHLEGSTARVHGVVIDAWLENKLGVAKLKLSRAWSSSDFVQKVREGVLGQTSVTYTVSKWKDVSGPNDEVPVLRALRWRPREVSFVCVNADTDSLSRSDSTHRGSSQMAVATNKKKLSKGQRRAIQTARRAARADVEKKLAAKRKALDRREAALARREAAVADAEDADPEDIDDAEDVDGEGEAEGARSDGEEAEGEEGSDGDDADAEDADDEVEARSDADEEDAEDADAEDDDEDAEDADDDDAPDGGSRYDDEGAADADMGDRNLPARRERRARAQRPSNFQRRRREQLLPARADARQPRSVVLRERQRADTILDLCNKAQLSGGFARKLVKSGVPLARAQQRIIDRWSERGSKNVSGTRGVQLIRDEHDSVRDGLQRALLYRFDREKYPLPKRDQTAAREFMGMNLREMARKSLEISSIPTRGMSISKIVGVALSRSAQGYSGTSDFSAVMENIATKTLRDGYKAAPQKWRSFCKTGFMPDFKPVSRVNFGGAPKLQLIGPNGEIKTGKLPDTTEKYALGTYASMFAINRQTIINDDLEAFTKVPMMFGVGARHMESDVVIAILTANAAMADTIALFHTSHGNKGTGVLSQANIQAARAAMALQTDLNGQKIDVEPATLYVPVALQMTAQQLTMPITPQQTSNVNPFVNILTPIADPRLDSNSVTGWFLFAANGEIDMVEIGYLEGENGPRIETEMGFETEGVRIKAVEDFAAKAIDHRGMYYSDGTA